MKHVFAVFCILSSLLCSASTYNLQLSDYSVETLIGSKSKEAGKEAILVGEILRHAARELAQNKAHYSEIRVPVFHCVCTEVDGFEEVKVKFFPPLIPPVMKHAAAIICILSHVIIAASAHSIPAEKHSLEALFGSELKEAARDAILVGQILRNAARDLTKGGSNYIPTEEY
ncbi:uncharacterized protein [Dermacentor andersoni]|uniref:uncharacterized protein isoform X3 n=1 Tax=Dermacentor andersoni TaxID=34620 RepID=UPI003B3ADF5D